MSRFTEHNVLGPNPQWMRVSRNYACPICGHTDWCLVLSDGTKAICPRIESSNRVRDAGWLHIVTNLHHPIRLMAKPRLRTKIEWTPIVNQLEASLTIELRIAIGRCLGVATSQLSNLGLGWNVQRRAMSFVMRDANGSVCGIRYRTLDGYKFAELGSSNGLFYKPSLLRQEYLLIVEGPTDTAAAMSLGFSSTVGRPNCNSGIELMRKLCSSLKPKSVIVIPDNDEPGRRGASELMNNLGRHTNIVLLPPGLKDVREVVRNEQAAIWLTATLRGLLGVKSIPREDRVNGPE